MNSVNAAQRLAVFFTLVLFLSSCSSQIGVFDDFEINSPLILTQNRCVINAIVVNVMVG